jgi:hypothetical protein
MANLDSTAPIAEKAQHDPHIPWFLTEATIPWATQSTSLAASTSGTKVPTFLVDGT